MKAEGEPIKDSVQDDGRIMKLEKAQFQISQQQVSNTERQVNEKEVLAAGPSVSCSMLSVIPAVSASLMYSPRELERQALKLKRAEHALEKERETCALLRHQLAAASYQSQGQSFMEEEQHPVAHPQPLCLSPRMQAPDVGGNSLQLGLQMHSHAFSQPSSFEAPPIHTLNESDQLQKELQATQTRLLQRTVEVERLRISAAEREAEATRLRQQLEGLLKGGKRTLEEELELERHVEELRQDKAKLKVEVGQLRGLEETWTVRLRAAEDRVRAADRVALDVQKQCEAAANTISRLIDENSELTYKVNLHGQALTRLRGEVRKREATIHALEQLMVFQGSRWTNSDYLTDGGPRTAAAEQLVVGDTQYSRTDQLSSLRLELRAAVEAAFRAQEVLNPSGGREGLSGSQEEEPSVPPTPRRISHAGLGTPLGGIPENEWKVRALEEEVISMEAQLEQERSDRRRLQQQLNSEQRVEHEQDSHLGGNVCAESLGAGLERESVSSVVANAAALSAGLPVNLRIQDLAQTLALLEEELEKERMQHQQLVQLRDMRVGMGVLDAQQPAGKVSSFVDIVAAGGLSMEGRSQDGLHVESESAGPGTGSISASTSSPHMVDSCFSSNGAPNTHQAHQARTSVLAVAPNPKAAKGPAHVIEVFHARGGVLLDKQVLVGRHQDHVGERPLDVKDPDTYVLTPFESRGGLTGYEGVAKHHDRVLSNDNNEHESVSTITTFGAASVQNHGAVHLDDDVSQESHHQSGSATTDVVLTSHLTEGGGHGGGTDIKNRLSVAAIVPEPSRSRNMRLGFWGWLTGADISSQTLLS
ncbi:hypothetical protein CEUSTIGMA_g8771.t1 [Chlamydomonas eustigma]|uniref:Uncharacterized protein n=1 Tax=Chlamydomonas eustigma TaxID=1157962 RepID=A0A250XEX7_9CHLO|nr:hypothetical protein CEUSTIGMA_g8771.t1 [Chlamydomonas eustigma]|eukprot:GAX81340.1 hypothetical protein CEUSTIGMA_g8771.t1 [Chlamydomonas eustigma]